MLYFDDDIDSEAGTEPRTSRTLLLHSPTNYEIIKDVAGLASAIMLIDLCITLNVFFNAERLSSISPEEDSEAASSIIFSMQTLWTITPATFFYMIFNVIYQKKYKDKQKVIVTASLLLALSLSIPMGILMYFSDQFYPSAAENIRDIVREYCSVFSVDFLFHFPAIALHQYLIARPADDIIDKKRRRNILYLGAVINFISVSGSSWLFTEIYPLGFLSKVETIAASFILGDIVRLLYYGIIFFREGFFESPKEITWETHFPIIKEICVGGWKLYFQLLSELGAWTALSFIVEKEPNATVNLDIFNAMAQWFLFLIVVPLALAQAAQQILAVKCSEGKYDQVPRYTNIISFLAILFHLSCLIVGLIYPVWFVSVFMNPAENNNSGMSGDFRVIVATVFVGLFFTAFRNIFGMSMRPLEMIKVPMFASISASWLVSVPAAVLLAHYTSWGVEAVFIGYFLGEFVGAINLLRIWFEVRNPQRVAAIHRDGKSEDNILSWHVPKAIRNCSAVMYRQIQKWLLPPSVSSLVEEGEGVQINPLTVL